MVPKHFCVLRVRDEQIPDLPKMAELSDSEIVELIIKHGRAEIRRRLDGTLEIEFQNGYD